MQALHRLSNFQRVAHGLAKRLLHRSKQRRGPHALGLRQADQCLCQDDGLGRIPHEGAGPVLDVQNESLDPLRDLLRDDAGANERDRGNGRRHVPQGVQPTVQRGDLRSLANHRAPDVRENGLELVQVQGGPETGDRLELVHRASGVAEAATGHHGHPKSVFGQERGQHQADLVADTTGRVLVDRGRAPIGTEVESSSRADDGPCECRELGSAHVVQKNRHQEGRHLVIRNVAGAVLGEETSELLVGELGAVPLTRDQLLGEHEPPVWGVIVCRRSVMQAVPSLFDDLGHPFAGAVSSLARPPGQAASLARRPVSQLTSVISRVLEGLARSLRPVLCLAYDLSASTGTALRGDEKRGGRSDDGSDGQACEKTDGFPVFVILHHILRAVREMRSGKLVQSLPYTNNLGRAESAPACPAARLLYFQVARSNTWNWKVQ